MMMGMNEAASTPPNGKDAILVRKVRQGDSSAWAGLVDQYSAYVYTLLRSARVPESDQPDAFQHVFVELFKAVPNLKNVDNLGPWIRVTTLRHAIALRKKGESAPVGIDEFESVLTTDADVARDLEGAETAQAIRGAIAGLKEKCRDLILRLFYADPPQPYAEVARSLGLKLDSLSMTRQRCLDALEKALRARGIQ